MAADLPAWLAGYRIKIATTTTPNASNIRAIATQATTMGMPKIPREISEILDEKRELRAEKSRRAMPLSQRLRACQTNYLRRQK
jgi:hypothetical protein